MMCRDIPTTLQSRASLDKKSLHIHRGLPENSTDLVNCQQDDLVLKLAEKATRCSSVSHAGILRQLSQDRFLPNPFQLINKPIIQHYTFSILATSSNNLKCRLATETELTKHQLLPEFDTLLTSLQIYTFDLSLILTVIIS
jgi:hypothetical protein